MFTTQVYPGQIVQFEHIKANAYTHRQGVVESVDTDRDLLTIRTAVDPKPTFKSFKRSQIHNFQIVG
jgi:hypothetical protein